MRAGSHRGSPASQRPPPMLGHDLARTTTRRGAAGVARKPAGQCAALDGTRSRCLFAIWRATASLAFAFQASARSAAATPIAVGFMRRLVSRLHRHDPAAPPHDADRGERRLRRLDRLSALGRGLSSHAGWPLTVDLWAKPLLAAGFCGYMAGGVRPNAYYRRRLPGALSGYKTGAMAKRFSTLGRYPTTRLRRNRREDWSRRLVRRDQAFGRRPDLAGVRAGGQQRAHARRLHAGRRPAHRRSLRRGRQGGARPRHPGDRDLPGDRSQGQDARRARGLQPRQPRLPRHPRREEGRAGHRRHLPTWRSIPSPATATTASCATASIAERRDASRPWSSRRSCRPRPAPTSARRPT